MGTRQAIERLGKDYATLVRAVVRRVGEDSMMDVVRHGADCGFSGFIYYHETVRFFRLHRAAILSLAENMAGETGEDVIGMIKGFRCLNGHYSAEEIGKAVYGRYCSDFDWVYNALAWFALGEVARAGWDN